VAKLIQTFKDDFNSYSKGMRITLYVLFALVLGFFISAIQILFFGLGYTGMSNTFTWGQWIIGDLGLVSLGGAAFMLCLFLGIFRVDKLQAMMNSAILIGFLCYLFTFVFLLFDLGQPLRAGFGFMYPNWGKHLLPQSMLTEVFFCLSIYFILLTIELVPIILEHKSLNMHPIPTAIAHYLHKLMWITAGAGAFLSFFHQGSLGGGMWGELYGKAAWYRPHFFFLAILATTAAGPSFVTLVTNIAGKIKKEQVVPKETFYTMAKIAGAFYILYFAYRLYDIYTMVSHFVPSFDRNYLDLWGGYYGIWMVVFEFIGVIIAIVLLNIKKFREKDKTMIIGLSAGIIGIIMTKLHVLLHGFSVPNFPWETFRGYNPSIQEWFITLGGLAIMILIYMFFAKYFPLFPEAKPLEKEE